VFCDPAPSEWPSPELKDNARTSFDSTSSLDYFDVFAGRREPLQRV
jgi:hypothetical protein